MSTRDSTGTGGRGVLFVISAPSGAGKTTLVRRLMERHPALRFSISFTTRPPRPGEVDGRDYFFVSPRRFADMVDANEFLEHATVFGHSYGTSRAQVDATLATGASILLEIDWQGAQQVRRNAPHCRSIFIFPPSIAELERRLRGRGTDPEDVIRRRLASSVGDLSHWEEFDFLVVNDDLEAALAALEEIIVRNGGEAFGTGERAVRERAAAVLAG